MSEPRHGDRFEAGEARPGELLRRPSLPPPDDAVHDGLRSWRAAGAALVWIVHGWLRAAGAEARWQQPAGRARPRSREAG